MRAKLDESIPIEAVETIRAAGWECDTVHEEGLGGAADDRIAEVCRAESRVLFTVDLDFADIRAYPPGDYIGLVVFRPAEPSRDAILSLLARALPVLASHWADGQLWVVEPSRIRTRGSGRVGV